jgi:hypothetical protein
LRICDLSGCGPDVARPADTSAFPGTDSHCRLKCFGDQRRVNKFYNKFQSTQSDFSAPLEAIGLYIDTLGGLSNAAQSCKTSCFLWVELCGLIPRATSPEYSPPRANSARRSLHFLSTKEAFTAAAQTDAVTIGCDASVSLAADTLCLDSIHFGATFRSSSGRFIVNTATTRS